LWDGFQLALKNKNDFIITLDGDAQHAPEDIDLLINKRKKHKKHIIIWFPLHCRRVLQ
jgi:hypothetical protein